MSEMLSLIQATGTLAAAVAAVLAWVAKIRWSEEFKAAKEAEIQALKTHHEQFKEAKDAEFAVVEARLETLRQLDPEALHDKVIAYKGIFDELLRAREMYAEDMQERLLIAEDMIATLRSQEQAAREELEDAMAANKRLQEEIANLRERMQEAREFEELRALSGDWLKVDAATAATASMYGRLTGSLLASSERSTPEQYY